MSCNKDEFTYSSLDTSVNIGLKSKRGTVEEVLLEDVCKIQEVEVGVRRYSRKMIRRAEKMVSMSKYVLLVHVMGLQGTFLIDLDSIQALIQART